MKCPSLVGYLFLWTTLLPVIGQAQGSRPSNAIPIILPVFQDSWMFEGKMGQRQAVPLKRSGDVVWYTFELEDDLVVYAWQYGGQSNQVSVEVLNKSLKTIARSGTNAFSERLVCNDQLNKGTYFIKVTSITSNGKPFPIELCKFSKAQTAEAQKLLKTRQQLAQRAAPRFTASQLVGRWRHVDRLRKLTTNLTFRQDGTYTGSLETNGQSSGSFSGKWSLKQDILLYEYTASSDKNIPAGVTDQDRVVEITSDHYTIENALGLETYVRIK